MKTIIIILCFLSSIATFAQVPSGSTKTNIVRVKGDLNGDSVLRVPLDTLTRAAAGSIGYKNGSFFGKYAAAWAAIGLSPGGSVGNVQFNNTTFGGSNNFSWDNSNNFATIITPALGASNPIMTSAGLILKNNTPATSGAPNQVTPPLHLQGTVWNTTTTTSQSVDWDIFARPASAASPISYLGFVGGLNGTYTSNQLYLVSNGNVHIDNSGSFINPESPFTVSESNVSITGYPNVYIKTNTAQGANVGAILGLGGLYNAGTSLPFGLIAGRKENGTSGNFDSYMSFSTRNNSIGVMEGGRFNSKAHLLIGTTADSNSTALLQVNGPVYIRPDSVKTVIADSLMGLGINTTAGSPDKGRIFKYTLPVIVGNDISSQTAQASITDYTVPTDGIYEASGYILVDGISSGSLDLVVEWTDHTSTFQSLTLDPDGTAGILITAPGSYNYNAVTVRCKAGTTLTVRVGGGAGAFTYDAGSTIKKIR